MTSKAKCVYCEGREFECHCAPKKARLKALWFPPKDAPRDGYELHKALLNDGPTGRIVRAFLVTSCRATIRRTVDSAYLRAVGSAEDPAAVWAKCWSTRKQSRKRQGRGGGSEPSESLQRQAPNLVSRPGTSQVPDLVDATEEAVAECLVAFSAIPKVHKVDATDLATAIAGGTPGPAALRRAFEVRARMVAGHLQDRDLRAVVRTVASRVAQRFRRAAGRQVRANLDGLSLLQGAPGKVVAGSLLGDLSPAQERAITDLFEGVPGPVTCKALGLVRNAKGKRTARPEDTGTPDLRALARLRLEAALAHFRPSDGALREAEKAIGAGELACEVTAELPRVPGGYHKDVLARLREELTGGEALLVAVDGIRAGRRVSGMAKEAGLPEAAVRVGYLQVLAFCAGLKEVPLRRDMPSFWSFPVRRRADWALDPEGPVTFEEELLSA
jgi:hypothetical protein